MELIVNGRTVKFLLDSGSTVTLIDKKTYRLIGKPTLKKTGMKISAYKSKKPIPLIGELSQLILTKSDG